MMRQRELTGVQILRPGPIIESEHNTAGLVLGLVRDRGRVPLDELFGTDSPDVAVRGRRDMGRDDDELGACVDGSRGRRRDGEGEDGDDGGEELHWQSFGSKGGFT